MAERSNITIKSANDDPQVTLNQKIDSLHDWFAHHIVSEFCYIALSLTILLENTTGADFCTAYLLLSRWKLL